MPFKLPKKLLEWLKQKTPEAKIDQLVSTIGQVNELIQGREDALSALVRKHIFMAEEDCNAALVNSKFDNKQNTSECIRRIEFGLFRLELAKQQLNSEQQESSLPNFDKNTIEYRALELSGAIIKTKMAIEFSNCVVSESGKLQLVGIVKMFNQAIELLKSNQQDKSRRLIEAGLLLLYIAKREIEIENHESIVDLSEIWKNSTRESQPIRQAIEASYNLKSACSNYPGHASPKILSRLNDAIEKLHRAIDNYSKANDEVLDELISTSVLQVKLAAEAWQSSPAQDNISPGNGQTNEQLSERLSDEIDNRISQFKTQILVLQRLVTNRATQAHLANRRLDAAEKYHQAAANMYRQALAAKDNKQSNSELNRQHLSEAIEKAETLARSATIDLEFARNLLFKKSGLPYQELVKRIAEDSDEG
ncbi:MAG: hypothetical protein C0508_20540 [Cyanobacteria bacterium PR.023]|nr:hypothetical protein [Cyanobacteria bacterium PR.023]